MRIERRSTERGLEAEGGVDLKHLEVEIERDVVHVFTRSHESIDRRGGDACCFDAGRPCLDGGPRCD